MKSEKRKKSENTIKEGHFQPLKENAHDAIVLYDATGRIKYDSKSLNKILGFNVKKMIGKFGTHFIHPDESEQTNKLVYTLLKQPCKSITLFQRIKPKKVGDIWSNSFLKIKIAVAKNEVKIEFAGNGIGIKLEYLDKISTCLPCN